MGPTSLRDYSRAKTIVNTVKVIVPIKDPSARVGIPSMFIPDFPVLMSCKIQYKHRKVEALLSELGISVLFSHFAAR